MQYIMIFPVSSSNDKVATRGKTEHVNKQSVVGNLVSLCWSGSVLYLWGPVMQFFLLRNNLMLFQQHTIMTFFGTTTPFGPGPPHSWVFWIKHNDALQSLGLLWTSDQLVSETSTWQHTTLTTNRHICPPLGFGPTISADERPQTYAL